MSQLDGKQIKNTSLGLNKINPATGQTLTLVGSTKIQQSQAPLVDDDLANKAYVDSIVTSAGLTATNGLTEIATNVVALGGTLSQSTTINAAGYDLIIGDVGNLMFTASVFDVSAEFVVIDAGTGSADIYADAGISLISIGGDVNITSNNNIVISGTAGDITTTGLKGLVYTTDYSATFVTHSLVDKAYVAGVERMSNRDVSGGYVGFQNITITTSSATPAIAIGSYRETYVDITAQAVPITSFIMTGTPTNGARLTIVIKPTSTVAVTPGSSFEARGVNLPSSALNAKRLTTTYLYDINTTKWGCTSNIQEF